MTNDSPQYLVEDEPIDLFELWNILWADKWLIIIVTAVFAIGSVIYALAQPEIYRSEALLASAEVRQPNNPLLSQLGAAAGLAGINVGNESSSRVDTAIATLQSREFIRQFIAKHNLMPMLLASEWDDNEGRNVIDPARYDYQSDSWNGPVPSELDGYSAFRALLSITENQGNGLVTIAIEWTDPNQAKEWVDWLIQDINSVFKQKDLSEANSAIGYLQQQLAATQLVEMQRVFYQLIESQTRTVMLADVRDEYVFRVVDPAYVPEQYIKPNRSAISILGTLVGGSLVLIFIFLRNALLNSKRHNTPA